MSNLTSLGDNFGVSWHILRQMKALFPFAKRRSRHLGPDNIGVGARGGLLETTTTFTARLHTSFFSSICPFFTTDMFGAVCDFTIPLVLV